MDLNKIAEEYRRLAARYESQSARARKAEHLHRNIAANAVQAGRLLFKAIEAGGFPKVRRDINGGWWDAEKGRLPGPPLALGGVAPDSSANDEDFAMLWTFSIGWLVRSFLESFPASASKWGWRHIATNEKGQPIGKDGEPLKSSWTLDGELQEGPLPIARLNALTLAGHEISWKREGEFAYTTDFYDADDGFEHGQIQAEVHGRACLILAELLEQEATIQALPKLAPGGRAGVSREDARLHRLACERGTYMAQQWCAIETALEQIEPWAEGQPDPKAARWYALVREAFGAAVNLAKQIRDKKKPSGEDFARAAANLDGLWRQAENEGKAIDLARWPREPASLAWLAEANTLEVAIRFSRAVYVETITAAQGNRNAGVRPQDALPVSDPFYEGMRDRFAAEVNQRLLNPNEWWPSMGAIHKEYGLAEQRLANEYEAWATNNTSIIAQPKQAGKALELQGTVKERLLQIWRSGQPYTSQRKLAEQINCSASAISDAIKQNTSLQQWAKQTDRTPKRIDAQPLNDVVLDNAIGSADIEQIDDYNDAKVQAKLAELIDQASDAERAKIHAMNDGQRRTLAITAIEQAIDQDSDREPKKA